MKYSRRDGTVERPGELAERHHAASPGWRSRIFEIIFEAETRSGKLFDVALIVCIVASVIVVMLDSVQSIRAVWGVELNLLEWLFTLLFSVEYILRIISVRRPMRYSLSFFGIIDLLAILPTYLSLVFPGTQYLIVIRILRVLRIFRVLKLALYVGEARILVDALKASRRKIAIFMFTVVTLVVIFGSMMYLIEGEQGGFTSIPAGIYWAVVTLTTVGYGDISPNTPLGRTLAAVIMILGYAIIAVPTGIVTAEMTAGKFKRTNTQVCEHCHATDHDDDAMHCKHCGSSLNKGG